MPAELDRLLLGARRGQPVRPVAVLSTERTVTRLLAADGRQLAEVADDSVRAAAAGPSATASSWREVEVELGAGDETLLQRVAELLCRHGARAVGERLQTVPGAVGPEPAGPDGPLRAYLIEQQRALISGDLALRRGDETVIHKTRVATRRFRSTLRNFAELIEQPNRQRLDEELRWYAGLLGEVRDRQVQRARLLAMVDELDDTLVLGPVRARVAQAAARAGRALGRVAAGAKGRRYLDLLTAVDEFIRSLPPKSASKRLRKLMRKAERKAANRLPRGRRRRRSGTAAPGPQGGQACPVRGRARAAAGWPAGGRAGRPQRSAEDLLGEHQDSLGSIELLKRLAAIAGSTPGESGFSYGILYQRQLQRAAEVRRQAAELARERT